MRIMVKALTRGSNTYDVLPTAHLSCGQCDLDVPDILRAPCFQGFIRGLLSSLQNKYEWKFYFTIGVLEEFLRFLELKCCTKDWKCRKIFPSPSVDKVWAKSMDDTRAYNKLCKMIFKKSGATGSLHFVHRITANQRRVRSTKIAYEARFNSPPDDVYWCEDDDTPPADVAPGCGCLCSLVCCDKGVSVHLQRLLFNGQNLQGCSDKTVSELGKADDCVVHEVEKLRGF